MSYEELMKEIGETQRIIFDENSKENEIADANIRLEKLMADYEKTPEYMAQKEEKRQANDKLNKAALEKGFSPLPSTLSPLPRPFLVSSISHIFLSLSSQSRANSRD